MFHPENNESKTTDAANNLAEERAPGIIII